MAMVMLDPWSSMCLPEEGQGLAPSVRVFYRGLMLTLNLPEAQPEARPYP